MLKNKKIWAIASLLPVVVLMTGCSKNDSKSDASPTTTTTSAAVDGSDDPGEQTGGVRIPLGETREINVPADAVLDIKGNPEWDRSALKCTVTDASGKQLDLLPPPADAQPEQAAHGGTWVPFSTIGAPAGDKLTVGCIDVDGKIGDHTAFVRVVPRGIMPMPG
ncbi:hypothetical protein ACFXHA_23280 [Nocardia sp. NPDC059240]|uniref:hypothetical protein n=1 Tax=Nocardia sp. NPDC059240 TaxID=3346786 RepID=UPI0036C52696